MTSLINFRVVLVAPLRPRNHYRACVCLCVISKQQHRGYLGPRATERERGRVVGREGGRREGERERASQTNFINEVSVLIMHFNAISIGNYLLFCTKLQNFRASPESL